MTLQPVSVRVANLTKRYGAHTAIDSASFEVEPGKTVTLLGPSGCGKTTTLRCIAGLEVPSSGRILVGDTVVYDHAAGILIEPEKRNIGMVFQSYAIWPHMTVAGNVGFPLRIQKCSRAETRERTARILDLVGLGDLAGRPASNLSGGQQQRVALARALVHEPRVVLFDEPLSNLDANLRDQMRTELQLLQARLGFTAIFVTHDQEEAFSLSDRVIIMNKGVIEQMGAPRDVFQEPDTSFAARFLGYSNSLSAMVVSARRDDLVELAIADGTHLTARWRSAKPARPGDEAIVVFRADRVTIQRAGAKPAGGNVLSGPVQTAAFLGAHMDYTIAIGRLQVKAEGPVDDPAVRGDVVTLSMPHEQCHAFPL